MEYERYDRDAALADMGSRLAGPALRARRRQYDIFVTPDAADAVWDGPAVEAERSRFTPSAEPSADAQTRLAAASMLLASASGLARQVPWHQFRGSARRMTALCVMGAAGFGLVMTDARPGAPVREHARRESAPIIADITPEAAEAAGQAAPAGDKAPAAKEPEAAMAPAQAATPVVETAEAAPQTPLQTPSSAAALSDAPDASPVQEARVLPASARRVVEAAPPAALPETPARAIAPAHPAKPPRITAVVQRAASLPGWSSKPAPRPPVILQTLPPRPVGAQARMARAAVPAARPALPAIRQAMVTQPVPPRAAPALLVRAMARRSVAHRMAVPDFALPHWLTDSEQVMPRVRIMSPQPHMLEGAATAQEAALPVQAPAPHPVIRPQYQPPLYANDAPRPPMPAQYYGYQPYYPPAYYPGYYPGYYAN